MKINTSFELDLKDIDMFYKLLTEEDFDFKTKEITIDFNKKNNLVMANINCTNILDLKIASTALIKSLEVITKTLNI